MPQAAVAHPRRAAGLHLDVVALRGLTQAAPLAVPFRIHRRGPAPDAPGRLQRLPAALAEGLPGTHALPAPRAHARLHADHSIVRGREALARSTSAYRSAGVAATRASSR
nr:hypothetical protein GCM10020093_000690 [Planobispora longispora]